RSGRGAGFIGLSGSARRAIVAVFAQRQRGAINFAAWAAGGMRYFVDGVFYREPRKRIAQEALGIRHAYLRLGSRWRDHNDDLAAQELAGACLRKCGKVAAFDLFMQFGQFPAPSRLALASEPGGEIGKGRRNARPGLEQDERRSNTREL